MAFDVLVKDLLKQILCNGKTACLDIASGGMHVAKMQTSSWSFAVMTRESLSQCTTQALATIG